MTDRQPPSPNDAEWPNPAAHHPQPHGNGNPSPAAPPDLAFDHKSDDSVPEPLKALNPNSLATDGRLVDFLRQHRPSPPPATPAIEQALLREIQTLQTQNTRRSWQWWAGGLGALAIGCVALLGGNNGAQRSAPIIADAELERFIEDTWVITVAPSTLSTTTASADDLLPWSFDPATWDSGPTKIVSNSLSAMVISPQTKPYL